MTSSSLTAAVWTPSGRGAVATVRVCGCVAVLSPKVAQVFRAASGRALIDTPRQQIAFGVWGREETEDVVVCRTGEGTCEIHCHGGDAAVRRILNDLRSLGCEIVDWRSQLEGECGVWEREHAETLAQATTLRAAGWIAAQAGRMEHAIAELTELVASGQRELVASRANEALAWANFGRHLTQPWEVVLAGRPNVGKSSLINALVGFERSIVFDEPGTTRDVVTADTVLDGWAIRLSDTAGQRGSAEVLEAAGIERAREAFAKADARLLLIDVSQSPHDDDWQLLANWPDAIVVAHKIDLPNAWGASLPTKAVRVSSLNRTGLDELSSLLVSRLVPTLPPENAIIPLTRHQVHELERLTSAESLGLENVASRG